MTRREALMWLAAPAFHAAARNDGAHAQRAANTAARPPDPAARTLTGNPLDLQLTPQALAVVEVSS